MKDLLLFVPLDTFAKAQYEFLPLGPLYLASYLSEAGFEVDVLHGLPEEIPPGYKFYGCSAPTAQYTMILKALKHIREVQPGAIVMAGGAHFNAKSCIEDALPSGWDYIVSGPGEKAAVEIMIGRAQDHVVYGSHLDDIDSAPFPAYDKIDISKYSFPLGDGRKCGTIITSRGCCFSCAFCSSARTKLKQRSVENVLEEIDLLVNTFGFNSLMFVDDTMSVGAARYESLLKGIEKFNIKWRAYGRTSTVSHKHLEMMKRAGCIECAPGIESGSQEILNLVGKKTKVENNIEWCRKCEEVGISCTPMVIIGLPGETPDTIKATRQFMEEAKPSKFGYNILMPFPDSPIMQNYDYWNQYITVHPYTWDDCVTKSKKITECFVSTPALSRERILKEYYRNFDMFADITGFDPRRRGTREDAGNYKDDYENS